MATTGSADRAALAPGGVPAGLAVGRSTGGGACEVDPGDRVACEVYGNPRVPGDSASGHDTPTGSRPVVLGPPGPAGRTRGRWRPGGTGRVKRPAAGTCPVTGGRLFIAHDRMFTRTGGAVFHRAGLSTGPGAGAVLRCGRGRPWTACPVFTNLRPVHPSAAPPPEGCGCGSAAPCRLPLHRLRTAVSTSCCCPSCSWPGCGASWLRRPPRGPMPRTAPLPSMPARARTAAARPAGHGSGRSAARRDSSAASSHPRPAGRRDIAGSTWRPDRAPRSGRPRPAAWCSRGWWPDGPW